MKRKTQKLWITASRLAAGLLAAGTLLAPASTDVSARSVRPVKVLNLRGDELSIGRVKGSPVLFKPGRRVRRAMYKTYRFRSRQFRKMLGDPKSINRAKVRVIILGRTTRIHKPRKGMPSPRGGFRFVEIRVGILKVLKVARKKPAAS